MVRTENGTSAPLDEVPVRQLRARLTAWYAERRRDLPWRRTRDPYRIWVAEVMLQQTRIAVVAPAYERFMSSFPNLSRLAAASEDEVLSLWSGLGYYARARALHRAARQLRAGGRITFPPTLDEALQLPGVGSYTAAAVLSIAYGEPQAAVDGNAIRVLSRLACLERPNPQGEPHRSLAAALLDRTQPGEWNQAVMELGETVCLPRAPRCIECPVRRLCRAYVKGTVAAHPPPRRRPTPERHELRLTVAHDHRGRVLLERGAFRHLPHMWLPLIGEAAADRAIPIGAFRHVILHREFRVQVFQRRLPAAELRRRAATGSSAMEREIFDAMALQRIGRSALLSKSIAKLPETLRVRLSRE